MVNKNGDNYMNIENGQIQKIIKHREWTDRDKSETKIMDKWRQKLNKDKEQRETKAKQR